MAEQFDYLRGGLSRRRFLIASGLALGGVATTGLWLQSTMTSGTPIGPRHVSFGADSSRQAVVSFSVPGPFGKATVHYGPDRTFGGVAGVSAQTVPGVSTVYGHAYIEGLLPGRRYFYRVDVDGQTSAISSFSTAAQAPTKFMFTAFGDEAVSSSAVRMVRQIATIDPAFHLLAGDICYADSSGGGRKTDAFDPKVWDSWLAMIEPAAESSPWMCATGNHDMEPGYGLHGYSGYLNRFPTPGNGAPGCPTTYTFRFGNVAVVALDANDVSYEFPHNLGYSGGRQTTWLADVLAGYRGAGSGVDFIVAFFHYCTFSTNNLHGSDLGVRENWVPLFDTFNVDLVINGHAHLYERAFPIRHGIVTKVVPAGGLLDSEAFGTTYITAGGGGAPVNEGFESSGLSMVVQKDGTHAPEPAPWSAPTRTNRHVFLLIEVTPAAAADAPTSMNIKAVTSHGNLVDEVTLTRKSRGSATKAVN